MITPNMSVSYKEMTQNKQTTLQELIGANYSGESSTSKPARDKTIITKDASKLMTIIVGNNLTEANHKEEFTTVKMMPAIDIDEQHITKSNKDDIALSKHNGSSGSHSTSQNYHSEDINDATLINTSTNLVENGIEITNNIGNTNIIDVGAMDTIDTVTMNLIHEDYMDTADTGTNSAGNMVTSEIVSRNTIDPINTIDIEATKTLNTNAVNTVYVALKNITLDGALVGTEILDAVDTQIPMDTGAKQTSAENTMNKL